MVLGHVTVTLIATFFAFFSLFHGLKNSRRSDPRRNDPRILTPYYFFTLLWALMAVYLGRDAAGRDWAGVAGAAFLVAIIHVIRVVFERTGTEEDAPEPWHRYAIDALANFSTIAFAVFATARGDRWYAVVTLFFGAMMFGKEFKFRVIDDIGNAAKGLLQPDRPAEPAPIRKRREFFANYMKSYCYIAIGCGIGYAALAVLDPKAGQVITSNGSAGWSSAWDALWFALRGFFLANETGNNPLLQMGMAAQCITFVAVVSYIGFSVYRGKD